MTVMNAIPYQKAAEGLRLGRSDALPNRGTYSPPPPYLALVRRAEPPRQAPNQRKK